MKGWKIDSITLKPDFRREENITSSTEILHNDTVKRVTTFFCKKRVNITLNEMSKIISGPWKQKKKVNNKLKSIYLWKTEFWVIIASLWLSPLGLLPSCPLPHLSSLGKTVALLLWASSETCSFAAKAIWRGWVWETPLLGWSWGTEGGSP